jgi:hypothetical protein
MRIFLDSGADHPQVVTGDSPFQGFPGREPSGCRVCESILRDEQEMANWLEQTLPTIVQEYLGVQTTVGAGGASMNPGTTRF